MTKNTFIKLLWVAAVSLATTLSQAEERQRIRDLGVSPGILPTGELNAITDVQGVSVGHQTLIRDGRVRTGVTAVLPHANGVFQSKVPAAVYVGNGYGKAAGFLQIQELGNIETPIVLTNTLSVGRAVETVVQWTLAQPGNQEVRSVNAVVGETNDGYLNDIRGMHVKSRDIIAAIENARSGPVQEGSVGAGTGTMCLGFKGGIGTSSRKLPEKLGGYTVGALVQTNFGGVLRIDGRRVGEQLGRYSFSSQLRPKTPAGPARATDNSGQSSAHQRGDGSVMIVVATDAPLLHRNLERMARRAILGLARTGSFMSNGSGDFVICFSTQNQIPHLSQHAVRTVETLDNQQMSPLFLAVVESVEEAVYNSLTQATTVKGREGHTAEAIPLESLRELLNK